MFNSVIGTPPSIASRASCGVSNKISACVFPKRGSFAASINFLIGTTLALTPPGAACLINPLRNSSLATVSDATMIRSALEAGVQLVATCPCKSRVSTRARLILSLPSPMTVPSGIAP